MTFEYHVLTPGDRTRLRLERVHALESDLCRIELGLEDALSLAERNDLDRDAAIIRQRLAPHYAKMGLTGPPGEAAGQEGAGDGETGPAVELSAAG